MTKQKIVVVDDHVLLRDAVCTMINQFENFMVTGAASSGADLAANLKRFQEPDILLLDLNMPQMDGYETANWLFKNYPDIKIIILSMHDFDIAMMRLLKVGVRCFLRKDIHRNEFQIALESVAEEGYYFPNKTTGRIASFMKGCRDITEEQQCDFLTTRELNLLKLVCSDMPYKEIADRLNLSFRVVDNCRNDLFTKLNIKSRVGLAIYAIKNGIVSF